MDIWADRLGFMSAPNATLSAYVAFLAEPPAATSPQTALRQTMHVTTLHLTPVEHLVGQHLLTMLALPNVATSAEPFAIYICALREWLC